MRRGRGSGSSPASGSTKRSKQSTIDSFFRRSSDIGSSIPASSQPASSQPGSSQSTQRPQPSATAQGKRKAAVASTSAQKPVRKYEKETAGPSSKQSVAPPPATRTSTYFDPIAAHKPHRSRVSASPRTPDAFRIIPASALVAPFPSTPVRPVQDMRTTTTKKRKHQDDNGLQPISITSPSTPKRKAPVTLVTPVPPQATPKRTPRRLQNKKPRLEVAGSDELVPSSQSDEQELGAVKPVVVQDARELVDNVQAWRLDAAGLPTDDLHFESFSPDAMDTDPLDLPVSLGFSSSLSDATPSLASAPDTPDQTPSKSKMLDFRPFTPPPEAEVLAEDIDDVSAVVPLDGKSKTAQIIADIRAQAALAVHSSPEDESNRELMELSDSSSDEDDNPFAARRAGGKTAADRRQASSSKFSSDSRSLRSRRTATPTLTSPDSPSAGPSRSISPVAYSTRSHGSRVTSAPVLGASTRTTRSQRSTSSPLVSRPAREPRAPAPLTMATKGKKRGANPLEAMLREKKKTERQGGGMDAQRRAESHDPDDVDSILDDEDLEDEALADEDAARRAAGAALHMRYDGEISTADEDEEVGAEDRERLLGEKEGKAVGKILDGDRDHGANARGDWQVGVNIWTPSGQHADTMEVEWPVPDWVDEETVVQNPVLKMLADAVKTQDVETVYFILNSQLPTPEDLGRSPRLNQWLYEEALLAPSRSALQFLVLSEAKLASPLSASILAQTFAKIGLRDDLLVFAQRNGELAPTVSSDASLNRGVVIDRMVELVISLAKFQSLDITAMPEFFTAMLLCGLDINASAETQRNVLMALVALCAELPATLEPDAVAGSLEAAIAEKVFLLASTLSITNQKHLLSFFARSSPPSLRISRCVAHHLLTDHVLEAANYSLLPSLTPLIEMLGDSKGLFEVADKTDYEALSSRVGVLGAALSGIESYVAEEGVLRRMTQVAALESSPRKGKDPAPLELVKKNLDLLHGKIVDTRAAHLDRSRAKAALKRLSLRVHYQRVALQNSGQRRLKDFWSHGQASRQPLGNRNPRTP
ncbi:hypothetical protein FA95DRAFT_1678458 [Auriscalpium vulgare]|uniref:Uncharacterized protein n=1 Tax=Auriscalpium vulgare TaxID=40419 RepID=A0ACB8RWV2_9AGAM|nr:hypothetical protein FA95DRAFT_1678458 [Auriscalpium vulgare]